MKAAALPFPGRMAAVRQAMAGVGVDVLLLSVGADLPWLCGYEAMPLERLTMLVLPAGGDATLVVPRLEAARVPDHGVVAIRAWEESDDPVAVVAASLPAGTTAAVGDRTWARFLLDLQAAAPGMSFVRAAPLVGPLRAVKDDHEVAALRRAAEAADRVATALQAGEVALCGRSEAEISADLGRRLVAEGHRRVNFAIVGGGSNGASPHHEPGSRAIERGDVVVCDFGGTMDDEFGVGYCSDVTRCVVVGEEPAPEVAEAYAVLAEAQAAGVAAARPGVATGAVDAACRSALAAAGYGERFIHRTGHGIGVEEHEEPYITDGGTDRLRPGHVFSVEPGIYTAGRWGMRLEDIVAVGADGPDPLNRADHGLVVVDA